MIGLAMRLLGVDKLAASLITYGLILAAVLGALWVYGHHQYSAGIAVGTAKERSAWQEQRELDIAKNEAAKAAAQRKIDAIEAANLSLERQIEDAAAEKALDNARRANSNKDAVGLSRNVGRALNKIGRTP